MPKNMDYQLHIPLLNSGNNLIISQIFCDWVANFYRINVECLYCTCFLLSCVGDFNKLYFEIMLFVSLEKLLQLLYTKCNGCGCDKLENVSTEGSCVILNIDDNYGLILILWTRNMF